MKTTLEVLCVSDLHLKQEGMDKLLKWNTEENNVKFDMIFAPGDFDNLSIYTKDLNEPGYPQSEKNIADFLTPLKIFDAPIYLVPGNHDPYTMFTQEDTNSKQLIIEELASKNIKAYNLHNKAMEVAKNLTIIGHGGSVPSWWDRTTMTKQKYVGFPYNSDNEYKDGFQTTLNHIEDHVKNKKDQSLILMTHIGPEMCGTSENYKSPHDADTSLGSYYLNHIVAKYHNDIIMNIHGHSHEGDGFKRYGKVVVFNPGSQGHHCEFARLTFVWDNEKNTWKIKRHEFLNLS